MNILAAALDAGLRTNAMEGFVPCDEFKAHIEDVKMGRLTLAELEAMTIQKYLVLP